MFLRHGHGFFLAGLFLMSAIATACADEGMWVFNNLPLGTLKARYGFEPAAGWADHLRSAAVRFNNGGSGSFVSADGLIMTNHHVGADTLAKLGTKDKDYYRDGFFAKTYDEEAKAPDLELNVLVGIEDVTTRVTAGVTAGLDDAAAERARRKAMAEIEKESTDKTGLRSDVVTLYQGGQYHLYTYKKYTDVRLVFAPEFDAAFFGGDPDNFEYPRYDLDVCFFRAYEHDKPARPPHHLKWSKNGTSDGDLVFVAGHPGRTDRLNTLASLEYQRDVAAPTTLDYLRTKEAFLLEYGSAGVRPFVSPRKTFSESRTVARRGSGAWEACAIGPSWPARQKGKMSFVPGGSRRQDVGQQRRKPPAGKRVDWPQGQGRPGPAAREAPRGTPPARTRARRRHTRLAGNGRAAHHGQPAAPVPHRAQDGRRTCPGT